MKIPEVDIKHILCTIDFSEDTQYIYAYAKRMAEQFGAKMTLLHVVAEELLDLLIFDVGIERSSGAKKRLSLLKEQFQNTRELIIQKLKSEIDEAESANIDIVVEKGNPVKVILDMSKKRNCDLIVMGFKGKGSLEDALIGNTVRRVLRRSSIPVYVVRHPGEKR